MGQEPFLKGSLDVATPFWRPKELHSTEILAGIRAIEPAVILPKFLVPMHPTHAVLISS